MRPAHSSSSRPDRHRAARGDAVGAVEGGDQRKRAGRACAVTLALVGADAAAAAGGGNLAAGPDEMAAGIAQGNSLRTGSSSCIFIPSHWNQIIIYAEVGNF